RWGVSRGWGRWAGAGGGRGRRVESKGGRLTGAGRLQAHPSQPVARRGLLDRGDLAQVKGRERAATSRLLLLHDLLPPGWVWPTAPTHRPYFSRTRRPPWNLLAEFVNTTLSIVGRLGLG